MIRVVSVNFEDTKQGTPGLDVNLVLSVVVVDVNLFRILESLSVQWAINYFGDGVA